MNRRLLKRFPSLRGDRHGVVPPRLLGVALEDESVRPVGRHPLDRVDAAVHGNVIDLSVRHVALVSEQDDLRLDGIQQGLPRKHRPQSQR